MGLSDSRTRMKHTRRIVSKNFPRTPKSPRAFLATAHPDWGLMSHKSRITQLSLVCPALYSGEGLPRYERLLFCGTRSEYRVGTIGDLSRTKRITLITVQHTLTHARSHTREVWWEHAGRAEALNDALLESCDHNFDRGERLELLGAGVPLGQTPHEAGHTKRNKQLIRWASERKN